MGRELQKKKNRSSTPKVRHKPKSKKINIRGNAIIEANWKQNETLSQNYRRLGLTSRLNASTGGIQPSSSSDSQSKRAPDPLAITSSTPRDLIPTTARVERAADGSILRVIHPPSEMRANPLDDPLASSSEDDEGAPSSEIINDRGVVSQLEQQARLEVTKRHRHQSKREEEWIERLVDAHGDDVAKMVRDRRLNVMQQSEGDLKRRLKKWKAARAE
ncbi:MAG: Nucleolar protein 16 [Caeruleum heppii]|nr:MAG: Nucleolar protein 16 [Caeruleum heppii]